MFPTHITYRDSITIQNTVKPICENLYFLMSNKIGPCILKSVNY